MQNNIIEISNLSLPYAFQEFNLSFERNKLTIITGPNNCGKTTIIKCIIGQIFTDNTVYIFSRELEYYRITELNMLMKYIIPQEYIFSEDSTIEELQNSINNLEISCKKKQKMIDEIMDDLKLTPYKNKKPDTLPENIKIKIELAKQLLQEPKILLLDDIFIYMTKEEKENIINVLRKYQSKSDLTIIITTSNLSDCLESDYIYVINNNSIVLEGEPLEVLQKDNILNRVGLELPFIIDLSVKLHDYDLINDIELDMTLDRMVNILWK